MPELPEVETVKNLLIPILVKQKITRIEVLRDSIIEGNKNDFITSLEGETFLNITRIGKYIIFHLSNDKVIISHLRMEGKYIEALENEEKSKYARVIFYLSNGHKICYDDSRAFGKLKLSNEANYLKEKEIAKLGVEPFKANAKEIYQKVNKSNLPIKSTLLDQTIMTGLGNIYADETLFMSKIHPLTPTKYISLKEWDEIIKNASNILNNAIKAGGSTIKSYHPGKGIDGNFQSELLAYGKKDKPCVNCGTLMRFIKVNGRGTIFCPHCQIKKSNTLKVALVGKTASGKTEALKIFKSLGYLTISADEVVNELYQEKDTIKLINKVFGFDFINQIDKKVLREYLVNNQKDIKKINHLIHPLVKEKIERFMKNKKGIVIAEVPLLFEAKMENLFDIIVGLDVSNKIQKERLALRDKNKANDIRLINANNKFNENKNKIDVIINNDGNLASLEEKIKKLINKWQSRLS